MNVNQYQVIAVDTKWIYKNKVFEVAGANV